MTSAENNKVNESSVRKHYMEKERLGARSKEMLDQARGTETEKTARTA